MRRVSDRSDADMVFRRVEALGGVRHDTAAPEPGSLPLALPRPIMAVMFSLDND